MSATDNFGYKDQEILIGAMAKHAAAALKMSEGVVRGKIRMTIDDMLKKTKLSLKDMKALEENRRDEFMLDFIDIFISKMNLDIKRRRNIKFDALQIYERWKAHKRLEVSEAEPYYPENLKPAARELQPPTDEAEKIKDSLIQEFEHLDLEGLD